MRFAPKSAVALALVFAPMLALAACGGGSEQAEPAASDTPAATDSTTPTEAAPTATPTPTDTASATPTPTPSATPTTAAAVEPAAFAVCKACHSVEPGMNGAGPSLAGIFGDKAGTVPGYEFSDAMKSSGLTWNQATLDRYLADPRGEVPGTKMGFGGLADAAKRQAIIDWIKAN